MRAWLVMLLLTGAVWAQSGPIEFPCFPGDAQVWLGDRLLGPTNVAIRLNRETLPEKATLIYRRPGWEEARIEVRREDLQGKFYPRGGNVVSLMPGTSLGDRFHQLSSALGSNLVWFGVIILMSVAAGAGQKAMHRRFGPQPRNSSRS